jgi:iron complex outermembrane recepter protein
MRLHKFIIKTGEFYMKKSRLLITVSVMGLALVAATPSYAQSTSSDAAAVQTEEEKAAAAKAAEGTAIVVTGSRIRRDEFSAIEPITVISKGEITQAGFNSATDALQSSEVTAGSAQINNFYGGFVTAGGTGANTLGLRNLGPARTLIMLNGRRLAPAGTRGQVLAADLNVLPTSIVQSIEVLKSGASSVYGSDAIAGVVNIITDKKIRGLSVEAQVNVPEIGAGIDRRLAATFGFGDDRFNLVGSLEYRNRNAVRLNDVDFAKCPIGGFIAGEGAELGSDDGVNFQGSPCFTLDNGGVTINTVGLPTRSGIGRTSGVAGNFNRFVPAPGTGGNTPDFLGVGFYDRDAFDPASQEEEVVTPVETYTGFFVGSYQLNALGDAEVYGEVLATRRKSSSKLYRQLSLDYLRGSPLVPLLFRNGTQQAANNTSSGQPVAARAFIGFGLTDSFQEVDYVRAGAGVRGNFFLENWKYDAYVGKSWTDGTYQIESFLVDRLANSLNVVQNVDGSFSCVSQASNANCVAAPPLNAATIGGQLSPQFRDYIVDNTIGNTKFRETTANFSIDGPLFALPGGDVQLALGAEYRSQRIDDTPDENSIRGNLYGLTAGVPTRGTDNVKEVYGEIFVPILSETPFFYNLNLNASARYTEYDSYGADTTYKIAGEWEFFKGFGVRGSYGTSYRAPALSEQFLGATSGFIGSGSDPCDADGFPADVTTYTPNQILRAANCATVGINVATFQQNNGITSFTRGGAETGLSAETSVNWSVGVVAKPELSSTTSLALALDYFNIKVDNGVSSLGGATILGRCYGAVEFDPNDGFCRFVTRDANNVLTVTSGFINLSTDVVKGFEFTGRLSSEILGGRFTLNANVTKYTEQSDRLFAEEFLLDSNGTLNTPDWVGTFDATYRSGPVTVRYGLSWVDSSSGTLELNATSRITGLVNQTTLQNLRDSVINEVPDYFLHSLSAQFNIAEKYELTVGVRNMFDKEPPRVTSNVTTVGNAPLYSGYDFVGRTFFVNTSFKF